MLEKELIKLANSEFMKKFVKADIQRMIEESEHSMNAYPGLAEEKKSKDHESLLTLDTYVSNFWLDLDVRFQVEFLEKPLCEILFDQPSVQKVHAPEFFSSHFKLKVVQKLQEMIATFSQTFMTDAEEKWNGFIIDELEK